MPGRGRLRTGVGDNRGMTATLATSGRILSPGSRDSTALAHDHGTVVWVGQDVPGIALHPDADRVDLMGDWVAPPFVEPLADGLDTTLAAELGCIPGDVPEPHAVGEIAGRIAEGRPVVVTADADLRAFAAELGRAAESHGGPAVARCTPMIVGTPRLDEATLATLARVGTVVLVRPLVEDLSGMDLVHLAGQGLVLAASLRRGDDLAPWDALRALTRVDGGRGLSPRAAFTAATRGAHRACGRRDGQVGTLVPGAPATYVRWLTGELVTVAADDAVQRWSTDPRSGVPPMPDLDGPQPCCRTLVVDGRARFDRTGGAEL